MGRSRLAEWRWQSDLCGCAPSCERARAPRKCDKERIGYRYCTGKKTPGGAGTHTGHTGHARYSTGTTAIETCVAAPSRRRPAAGYLYNSRTVSGTRVSQSVSYFTVPPRAHPSTGSQSGSATPGLHEVPTDPRARAPHERQRACAACSTKISPANHKALGRVRVVLAPGRRRELRPQGQLGG